MYNFKLKKQIEQTQQTLINEEVQTTQWQEAETKKKYMSLYFNKQYIIFASFNKIE